MKYLIAYSKEQADIWARDNGFTRYKYTVILKPEDLIGHEFNSEDIFGDSLRYAIMSRLRDEPVGYDGIKGYTCNKCGKKI